MADHDGILVILPATTEEVVEVRIKQERQERQEEFIGEVGVDGLYR